MSTKPHPEQTAAAGDSSPPAATPARGISRRLWLVLALCLVGSAAVSFILFRYVFVPRVPRALVGTWQVQNGALRGSTLKFTWHGTAVAIEDTRNGKQEATNFSVEVADDQIALTVKGPNNLKKVLNQKILRLTDDELVIRDEDGIVYRMTRIGD